MKLNHLGAAIFVLASMVGTSSFASTGTTIDPIGAQDYDTGILGNIGATPVFFYGGIRPTPDPVNTFTFGLTKKSDLYGQLAPFGGKITFEAVQVGGPMVTTSVDASGQFSFTNLAAGSYTLNVLATNFKPGQLGFTGSIYGAVVAVPEPSSYALTFAGLAVAGALMRRRKMA